MTSLDRAKHFLAQKGKAIAITIVPLAGLVVTQAPANATPPQTLTALNPSSCGVSALNGVSVSGDECADVAESASDSTDLLGVKIYSETSLTPSPITASSGSGGTYGLEIYVSGGTTGTLFTGSIPVSWDFTVTTNDGNDFSYYLEYGAVGSPGGSFSMGNLSSFTNVSGSTISGTNAINLAGEPVGVGTVDGWFVELEVEEASSIGASQSLTVNVPTNSLDIASSSTPEPASILLFGTGLAGLLLRRLRRARS